MLSWWSSWMEGALLGGGAFMAWALALYVITRGGMRRVPVVAAAALGTLASYLLGQGLAALAPDSPAWVAWLRRTWWSAALIPALWLLLTLALAADETGDALRPRLRRIFWAAAATTLPLGAIFALMATTTDLVLDWRAARSETSPIGLGANTIIGYAPPGPFYTAYQLYLLICASWAAGNLLVLWRASGPGTPLRVRFGWLLVSASLFLLSSALLTIASRLFLLPGLPGHLLLIAGIAIMGWNVARYGALVAGEVVFADALAFGVSFVAVTALYGTLLLLLGPLDYAWLERVIPVLLLVGATHVFAGSRRPLFDRWIYGAVTSEIRQQLRALAGRVTRQPDLLTALADMRETMDAIVRAVRLPEPETAAPPASPGESRPLSPVREALAAMAGTAIAASTEREDEPTAAGGGTSGTAVPVPDGAGRAMAAGGLAIAPAVAPATAVPAAFRLLVEGALRHLNDVPALSEHPLLHELAMATQSDGTALERATVLRAELIAAIDRLHPPGARPAPGAQAAQGGWLHFVVLHEAYVEGRPNKQVMQRYHLSEGTFHRARRRAIDAITTDLYERGPGRETAPG